jgi:DNA-binding HxlR family transcriptional regulator
MAKKIEKNKDACQFRLLATRDALEIIQGKWRVPIIISLTYGNKRFGEIKRDIADISPKMLSQELKVLEEYKIISRILYESIPITVEYELTPLGLSLENLLAEMLNWGIHFRKEIIGK